MPAATIKGTHVWRRSALTDTADVMPEEPVNESKKVKRAFAYLVQDGVLTADEMRDMVKLIGSRNSIAHHLDHVTADFTTDRFVRDFVEYIPNRQSHDYEALDKLRAARKLLSDRMMSKHYIFEAHLRSLFFDATERALTADIKALDRRIRKLARARCDDIAALNAEMSLVGSELTGVFHPSWFENRYKERGRLTPRGVETCYRLFDMGKSAMAVAHLMDLSLRSARNRERVWLGQGGSNRPKRELAGIPAFAIRSRERE